MPVELQALWTLHGDRTSPRSLYLHGYPSGAGALTAAIAQDLNLADRRLDDLPSRVGRAAEALWREVLRKSISAGEIDVDGLSVRVTGPEHLTHHVTPRWADQAVDSTVVTWNREPRTPDGRVINVAQQVIVSLDSLSPSARQGVHRLNGLAREALAERYRAAVARMTERPPADLELRKVRGFLSYRTNHRSIARRVHDAFEAYGFGVHFEIYLDEHDRELGDLREQLAREISARQLFVIVCTADYAEKGRLSAFEFDVADARRRQRQIEFAPIVIAEPHPLIWQVLEPLLRVRLRSEDAILGEDFQDMLRTCLGSVDAI